jgi:hypothetical protein
MIAGAVTVVPLPFDGPGYEVIIGIAFAVAGIAALAVRQPSSPAAARPPTQAEAQPAA